MGVILAIMVSYVCSYILFRESRRSKTGIDLGFLLAAVISISLSCLHIAYYIYYQDVNTIGWEIWKYPEGLRLITYLNVGYVVAFVIFHLLLKKFRYGFFEAKNRFYLPGNSNPLAKAIVVYIFTLAIALYLKISGKLYLWAYWLAVVDLAYYILLACFLSKIKKPSVMIAVTGIFACFLMFIYYPLFVEAVEEHYAVNKGGVALMLVFTIVYLNIARYKGKLITPLRLCVGLLLMPVFIGSANFAEALVTGSPVGITDFIIYVTQGYELRMYENQYLILTWLENGEMLPQYGMSYLGALWDIVYPTSGVQHPGQWLTEITNIGQEGPQSGRNFSFVAEGILNFGPYGVIFAALVSALVIYLIENFLNASRVYGPILYSILAAAPYYIYRVDFSYVIKKIEFNVLGLIIIFFLYAFTSFLFRGAKGVRHKQFTQQQEVA
tara:strand:+ start:2067 stop:3383 length:1317 start_codon:yes stop_codon:yes gene_type:complete